jgi:hypothetical protein
MPSQPAVAARQQPEISIRNQFVVVWQRCRSGRRPAGGPAREIATWPSETAGQATFGVSPRRMCCCTPWATSSSKQGFSRQGQSDEASLNPNCIDRAGPFPSGARGPGERSEHDQREPITVRRPGVHRSGVVWGPAVVREPLWIQRPVGLERPVGVRGSIRLRGSIRFLRPVWFLGGGLWKSVGQSLAVGQSTVDG